MQTIFTFIATVFYVGKLPKAPGTWGSVVVPVTLLMVVLFYGVEGFDALTNLWLMIPLLGIIYIVGTYATYRYMLYTKQYDPKEVVIDEVIGQLLAYVLGAHAMVFLEMTSFSHFIVFLCLLFLLFRVFDITKLGFIGMIDKNIKGANGVMLDDIAAGVVAACIYGVLVFLFDALYIEH